ncbi:hypothetical protein [Bacillus sp. JJ722]|uniref:hypothetical protein n=1 Tax=Bacillus sp. JJ722 TaxID=3122973 RepID=UPI002FFE4FB7
MIRTEYVVIIVDTSEQADAINYAIPRYSDDHMIDCKTEAFPVGTAFCGLRHKHKRPTIVIRAHKPLTTERELYWERECLRNIGYPDERTKWIGGERP